MDLNLLRTFLTILDTGSVTAAADELELTQPTVSHALGRLRRQLGDPLFVRQGSRLVPTARALELGPQLRSSLARIDDALDTGREFDPRTTTRQFRLCLSDVGEASFLPSILRALRVQAPLAAVTAVPTHIDHVTGWLRRGEVDAAVASIPLEVDGVHTILPGERYVLVMAPELAPPRARMTVPDLLGLRYAAVDQRVGHEQLDESLVAIGVHRDAVLRIQHFSVLPQLAAAGDVVAILPAQMAQAVAPHWGLEIRELPLATPRYDVNLYWDTAITGGTGARAWFVNLLRGALADLAPARPAADG